MQPFRPAKLLHLHFNQRDRFRGKPLHEAIVDKCMELKIAGATVFQGFEGFGETAELHRSHLLARDMPVVIQIVDSEENIQRLLPFVEEMIDQGLIAISGVEILRVQKSPAA
jgi:PII-like signaling protein